MRARETLETDLAKPDVRDDAFIREVDDEYRRAQLEGWWSRYGRALAIGVVVLLAVLAGVLYWRAERVRQAGLTGETFAQALTKVEAGNAAGAAPVLADLAGSRTPGYAALARLTQAAVALQAGDQKKALTIYTAIAADSATATPFRDLALVKATRLEFDTLPPATIVARLKPLSVPGNPWFAVAGEMTAVAHIRDRKPDAASPLLVAIIRDTNAPPSLRNRAAQLAVSLGVDPATLVPPRVLTPGSAQ